MKRDIQDLADERFDILVIGGGITGAGCARDAALRGLRTALIEKGDFASGTSSASSKLIHGGLRYLEQYDFRLVHEALKERSLLLRLCPHLVRPLRFRIPLYAGWKRGPLMMKAGLTLYDLLAGRRKVGRHAMLSRDRMLQASPGLHPDGLKGGASYFDASMDDARLCLVNAIDADRRGAIVANYVQADRIAHDSQGFRVACRDLANDGAFDITARTILNTTGPWSDEFLSETMDKTVSRLDISKGAHLVCAGQTSPDAMLLFAPDDRVFFMIPWYGATLVGTTDTAFDRNPDEVRPEPSDVNYLLEAISDYFDTRDQWATRLSGSFAGVRPLVQAGSQGTYRASREHLIAEDLPGLFSIVGGKYTTYRLMAEQGVDAIVKKLGKGDPCRTRTEPLPGGEIDQFESWRTGKLQQLRPRLPDEEMGDYLIHVFGSEVDLVLDRIIAEKDGLERIDPRFPVPRGLAEYCRIEEMALTDEDFLRRRTPLALLGYDAER
ncbi:glycerol-3-phosphate dehydrogenase [bacterium]|nr:glycerol-3-phosphate dehydrogenase [bacterium]